MRALTTTLILAALSTPVWAQDASGPEWIDQQKQRILAAKEIALVKKLSRDLVQSKDPAAQKVAVGLLKDRKLGDKRCGIILGYGFAGNKKAVKILAALFGDRSPEIRSHVAVALEDIADKSALRYIKKQLQREKEEQVVKNLARALGACGSKDAASAKELLKLSRGKSELVQRNAIVALSHFSRNTKVQKTLIRYAFLSGGRPAGGGGAAPGGRSASGQLDDWQARQGRVRAAALSLGIMKCREAVDKAQKRLEHENEAPIAGSIRRCLALIAGQVEPTDEKVLKERRELCGDRIIRESDTAKPKPKKKKK